MATGATVPGLYSHIAHLVDKEEGEIPPPFILPQVRIMATDLLMVQVVTNNLEVSHNETEAKDLNIINVNFRDAHFNRTVLSMAIASNPTFREIK